MLSPKERSVSAVVTFASCRAVVVGVGRTRKETLDGGSLGSSVDEERGYPRELMRIAGLSEHRHLERTLRPRDPIVPGPRPVERRLRYNHAVRRPPSTWKGGGKSGVAAEKRRRNERLRLPYCQTALRSVATTKAQTAAAAAAVRPRPRRRPSLFRVRRSTFAL